MERLIGFGGIRVFSSKSTYIIRFLGDCSTSTFPGVKNVLVINLVQFICFVIIHDYGRCHTGTDTIYSLEMRKYVR